MKETSQHSPHRSLTLPVMAAPDDNLSGISRPPEICVDYLSHEWKEYDIWTSWKAMSKQKNEIANGVRLENASWRTWTKQKYHLRTVNPSKLNWMKDSDVTWLYGPLHTAHSSLLVETSPKSSVTEDLMGTRFYKSCLKKKSISEVFRFNPRPRACLSSSSSDTQLYQKDSDESSVSSNSSLSTMGYHIRFNNKVEQYMAVDSEEDFEEEEEEEDMTDDNSDESGSNSDDSAIVMKISRGRRHTKNSTICKLEPTTLKSDRILDNQYSALYSTRRNSKRSSSSSSSRSTQRSTTTTTTTTTTSTTTTATPSSSPIEPSSIQFQSYCSDSSSYLSSSPNSLPSPTISLPYPTYSNSCASCSDELDIDDYTGFGVFAQEIFDEKENRGNDIEFDEVGLVDRAVHIASNVKDIVHWCSSMVFNSQVL